jgi:hypothetical protein
MQMLDLDMRRLSPEGLASKRAFYLASFEQRFWEQVPLGPGCRPWQGRRGAEGYGNVTRLGKTLKAHRAAWELTYGPIPEGMVVCHRCDNPPCCEPTHLFLGTRADNNDDREQKGRGVHPKGSAHPNAKLTEEAVLAIRREWASIPRRSLDTIAASYGVSRSTIHFVVSGGTWKHARG